MLERLHFILGGCVGEGTQDIDRIVALLRLLLLSQFCVFLSL